jgi:hypothetical protein
LATFGGALLSLVVLGTERAPLWLRTVVWIVIGVGVASVFVRASRRRLEIYRDRLVIVSGRERREIHFREIEVWVMPLGASLALKVEGSKKAVSISGWARGGDLVAELLAAIRVAGSKFVAQPDGRIHRVLWDE